MQGYYAGKSHKHKPMKGLGSYRRKKVDEEAIEAEKEIEWTEEEEEAFEELTDRQEGLDG